jgi:hypothetical protein
MRSIAPEETLYDMGGLSRTAILITPSDDLIIRYKM